jgi:hypothetical protein
METKYKIVGLLKGDDVVQFVTIVVFVEFSVEVFYRYLKKITISR